MVNILNMLKRVSVVSGIVFGLIIGSTGSAFAQGYYCAPSSEHDAEKLAEMPQLSFMVHNNTLLLPGAGCNVNLPLIEGVVRWCRVGDQILGLREQGSVSVLRLADGGYIGFNCQEASY